MAEPMEQFPASNKEDTAAMPTDADVAAYVAKNGFAAEKKTASTPSRKTNSSDDVENILRLIDENSRILDKKIEEGKADLQGIDRVESTLAKVDDGLKNLSIATTRSMLKDPEALNDFENRQKRQFHVRYVAYLASRKTLPPEVTEHPIKKKMLAQIDGMIGLAYAQYEKYYNEFKANPDDVSEEKTTEQWAYMVAAVNTMGRMLDEYDKLLGNYENFADIMKDQVRQYGVDKDYRKKVDELWASAQEKRNAFFAENPDPSKDTEEMAALRMILTDSMKLFEKHIPNYHKSETDKRVTFLAMRQIREAADSYQMSNELAKEFPEESESIKMAKAKEGTERTADVAAAEAKIDKAPAIRSRDMNVPTDADVAAYVLKSGITTQSVASASPTPVERKAASPLVPEMDGVRPAQSPLRPDASAITRRAFEPDAAPSVDVKLERARKASVANIDTNVRELVAEDPEEEIELAPTPQMIAFASARLAANGKAVAVPASDESELTLSSETQPVTPAEYALANGEIFVPAANAFVAFYGPDGKRVIDFVRLEDAETGTRGRVEAMRTANGWIVRPAPGLLGTVLLQAGTVNHWVPLDGRAPFSQEAVPPAPRNRVAYGQTYGTEERRPFLRRFFGGNRG